MTEIRETLHRWAVWCSLVLTLSAAAFRHIRRAKRRRRFRRYWDEVSW